MVKVNAITRSKLVPQTFPFTVKSLMVMFALRVIVQALVNVMVQLSALVGTPAGLQFVPVLKLVPPPPEPCPTQALFTAEELRANTLKIIAVKESLNMFFIAYIL